jgi:L-Ala-D/L-Glu epimerase
MRSLQASAEDWPIRGNFTISRGTKRVAQVVSVAIAEGGRCGRGECVPYARYEESVSGVLSQIESLRTRIEGGLDRAQLQEDCPPGAARNALDCALWDLEAKKAGLPVWRLAGLPEPAPCITAYTLSLDTPMAMGRAAEQARGFPLLKLKLAREAVLDSVAAVHRAAPGARLIVDANEAWDLDLLREAAPRLHELNVALIEQPLPASEDEELAGIACPVPLCADESCHGLDGLARLRERYQYINIKLDKTGGLTAALALAHAAAAEGFGVMVGCMVGTSLAMAPAVLLAGMAKFVDLDGPLLLERDRVMALHYGEGGILHPPAPGLWG